MARHEIVATSVAGGRTFWINETKVGQNQFGGKKSDVELVQFFLKQFFLQHPELFKKLPKTRTNASFILIDGVVGDQTIEGIRSFQTFQKGGDPKQVADGVVSVPPFGHTGILHAGMHTILKLNLWIGAKTNIDTSHLERHLDILMFAPNLLREMVFKP